MAATETRGGVTVRDAMTGLAIPEELPNILLVQGRRAPAGAAPRDGEALSIFPPLAGGARRLHTVPSSS